MWLLQSMMTSYTTSEGCSGALGTTSMRVSDQINAKTLCWALSKGAASTEKPTVQPSLIQRILFGGLIKMLKQEADTLPAHLGELRLSYTQASTPGQKEHGRQLPEASLQSEQLPIEPLAKAFCLRRNKCGED